MRAELAQRKLIGRYEFMSEHVSLATKVPDSLIGKRLDQALATLFPDFSRMRLKEWILAGFVQLDEQIVTIPKTKLIGGELVNIEAQIEVAVVDLPQEIRLEIVYEDPHLLVVNKPAGLVVHPGAGNHQGTLLNGLLEYYPAIKQVPRAGIIHRLDKDTTGLMVVAKTVEAQTHLVAALQARQITREYEAICIGTMTAGGVVNQPIGRHPSKRTQMAVNENGKTAITYYRVAEKFRDHTRLRLRLETGRTHQIRVHMAALNHPLVGDPVYGGRPRLPKHSDQQLITILQSFPRQALHAAKLSLYHPINAELIEWQVPLPTDMAQLNAALRLDLATFPGN